MAGISGFHLLSFVTICLVIGALLQLSSLRKLEQTGGFGDSTFRRSTQLLPQSSEGLKWVGDEDARLLRVGQVKQEVISWAPRIILLHDFLSSEECDHLMAVARPKLAKSTVVDRRTGKGIESKVRTSTGMFVTTKDRKHSIIEAIENRIAVFAMVPVENGELLQVLRYEPGQYYDPHHDYFSDEFNKRRGGQRVATMLMYLSDGVEGGETFFPSAGGGSECSCGGELKKGLCISPKRGDAVLFWSLGFDGQPDHTSLHGGCKVLKGEKWSSTKWMRQRAFT